MPLWFWKSELGTRNGRKSPPGNNRWSLIRVKIEKGHDRNKEQLYKFDCCWNENEPESLILMPVCEEHLVP